MKDVVDIELDLCDLKCPMPLLKTKQALNRMQSGQTVQVLATDPGSMRDFQVFAEQSGHLLLKKQQVDGKFLYLLQKS